MIDPANNIGASLGPAGRFRIEKQLGIGSTGVVYAAWDNERGVRVALKTLQHMDAEGIYHLKQEFRSLAEVSHPNLVRLYELFGEADKERWFVTMELIEGIDFISYVRDDPTFGKLRSAFRQLVQGMDALHRAGKLHRDVKPSNALVTIEGRVVLLDFGLVTDIALSQIFNTLEPKLVGTPAYLSPEQATGETLGPSTDFYAAGAMLYEALAGQLPFVGTLLTVLRAKQSTPPSPTLLAPHIPKDLSDLCEALLRVNPASRPHSNDVLAVIEGPKPVERPAMSDAGIWVGRVCELEAIHAAFEEARQGHTVVVSLQGSSGVGKSALLRRALEQIASHDDSIVLAGRCFERELVPYRGLDNVVDALTRHLGRLSAHEAETLVPRDADALTRIFPVLRRVPAFDRPRRRAEKDDALIQRRRAWTSFRELLGRIADRKTLVICIDDCQWGDDDSARLLLELLCAPDAPPLLLLICHRDEDVGQSHCLRTITEGLCGKAAADVRQHRIYLLPFEAQDAEAFAKSLLGENKADPGSLALEAGGNAFFLRALVEHVRSEQRPPDANAAIVTLVQVIEARLNKLTLAARQLLDVLAIAGRPMLGQDANSAAGLLPADIDAAMELRTMHLLRSRGDTVEIDHDKIRQTVIGILDLQTQRKLHRQILATLQTREYADPEIIGSHQLALGEDKQAGESFYAAGLLAEEALAFDRAAHLFSRAIELRGAACSNLQKAHEHLGDALVNLGKGTDAATAFLKAAETATPSNALDLRRKAAEQQLRIGQLEAGMGTLKLVLAGVGEKLAPSSRRALISLLVRRALIRLRGLHYRERAAKEINPDELVRLDVFWSVATALGIIDNIRAMDFQTRHLRLALTLGEPYRIARALGVEVGFLAVKGTGSTKRRERLMAVAKLAAERVNDPFAPAWATLAAGMAKYVRAQHLEARLLCEQAEATFQGCVGVWWEMGSARLFGAWSLFYLGEWTTLARRLPAQVSEAEDRGDLYTATSLSSSVLTIRWLMNDDPLGGQQALDALIKRWPRTEFHALDYWHMVAQCTMALYQQQGETAWQQLLRDERGLKRSLLLRVQTVRVEFGELQGRCLVMRAMAATDNMQRSRLLKQTAKIAHKLAKAATPWSEALAAGLRAGIAATRGAASAAADYEQAAVAFDRANMQAHAAAARMQARQMDLEQGSATLPPGDAMAADTAESWFAAQGVKRPLRMARLLCPGGRSPA